VDEIELLEGGVY